METVPCAGSVAQLACAACPMARHIAALYDDVARLDQEREVALSVIASVEAERAARCSGPYRARPGLRVVAPLAAT